MTPVDTVQEAAIPMTKTTCTSERSHNLVVNFVGEDSLASVFNGVPVPYLTSLQTESQQNQSQTSSTMS